MSGQIILARPDKTQKRFFTGYRDQTPPGKPILSRCAIFLWIYAIVTVLKRAFSRKLNTRRDHEEEYSLSGKSTIFYGIPGYGQFFYGKSGSDIPPGWPLLTFGIILFSYLTITRFMYKTF